MRRAHRVGRSRDGPMIKGDRMDVAIADLEQMQFDIFYIISK